jgi:exonuclease VII small subunit
MLSKQLIRARSVVGIATGHDDLEQVVLSLQGLINARGCMAQCHAALVTARQQVQGLRTVSFGDSQACPPRPQAVLKVVA